MHHDLQALADPGAVAAAGAAFVAERARAAVAASGSFRFAVSGGHTPSAMFAELARSPGTTWSSTIRTSAWPRPMTPTRNLSHLTKALGSAPAQVRPMPVNDSDLVAAAAALLPEHFGPWFTWASRSRRARPPQVPRGIQVLSVTDRALMLSPALPRGGCGMTLTYPALARARQILWLVTGSDKKEPLARLLADDTSVRRPRGTAAGDGRPCGDTTVRLWRP